MMGLSFSRILAILSKEFTQLVRDRLTYAMIIGSLTLGTTIGLTVYLPLYYEVVYGLAASQAGLALIPLVAVSVIGSTAVGRVMSRMHRYKWVAIAGTGLAAVLS